MIHDNNIIAACLFFLVQYIQEFKEFQICRQQFRVWPKYNCLKNFIDILFVNRSPIGEIEDMEAISYSEPLENN